MSNNLCKRTHLPKYRVFDLACAYLEAYSPQRNVVQDTSTCNSSNCLCRESPNNRLCPGVQSPWHPIKHTETKQTAGHVDNCHDSILYRTFCQLVTYNLTAPPFVSVHPLDYYTIRIPVLLARGFCFLTDIINFICRFCNTYGPQARGHPCEFQNSRGFHTITQTMLTSLRHCRAPV
jgi:hypothetical protein